jgi:hypothetical protein
MFHFKCYLDLQWTFAMPECWPNVYCLTAFNRRQQLFMKVLIPAIAFFLNISFIYAQKSDSVVSERHGDSVITAQPVDSAKSKKIVLPWFVERFKFSAGAFYVINKTNIQVEAQGINGSEIDFEKDLGINRELATFLANFQWQISRRSRITLNYYNVSRSSDHTLQKDIVFNGNTYYANTNVQSFFNTTIYQFSYGYAIFSKPKYEAGVFIGTHILEANAGISLDGMNAGQTVKTDFGFTAPLPDLGIWGAFAVSNRFAINADISYFALTLNNKSGRLLAFNLNFTYKLVKELDLTLGYTGLNFKVDVVRKDATGNFKWGYNGPAIAFNYSFGKKSWTH